MRLKRILPGGPHDSASSLLAVFLQWWGVIWSSMWKDYDAACAKRRQLPGSRRVSCDGRLMYSENAVLGERIHFERGKNSEVVACEVQT
jgi:hypothetical protein